MNSFVVLRRIFHFIGFTNNNFRATILVRCLYEGAKATQTKYMVPWIPLQSHGWFFERLLIYLDSSSVSLGPNVWFSSLDQISLLEGICSGHRYQA